MKKRFVPCAFVLVLALASAASGQCEEAKLLPTVLVGGTCCNFSSDVDIDGDRAIVGQPVLNGFGESAYVYLRSGSTWVLDERLTQPGQELDVHFGGGVAIEGDLAAVSARYDDQAGPDYGAVHVYRRSGGTWSWIAKLLPSAAGSPWDPQFGWFDVAIEGGAVVVGAYTEGPPTGGVPDGVVYVFEELGGQWVEFQKLSGPDLAPNLPDSFGRRLATDGNQIAVGIPYRLTLDYSWQVRIFERTGPSQPYQFLDAVDAPAGEDFGFEIAVDFDGDDLVVGTHNHAFAKSGSAYFHRRNGGVWTLVDTFHSIDFNPSHNPWFGSKGVAVEDGLALVADPSWYTGGEVFTGSAHMFLFDGAGWIHRGRVQPTDGALGDGYSLDLALDAGRAIFGAEDHGSWGAAYVVDMTPLPAVYCTGKSNSLGCTATVDWHGIASLTNVQSFDVTATAILSNKPGLFFYGTSGTAAIPFLDGTLCAQPPLSRTPPQVSGGQGPPDTCTGTFTYDLNARIQSGADPDLVPGAAVAGQFWSRDPDQHDGTGVHLTEAIEVTVCP